ncbi:MAG: hypothetical protein PHW73_15195 [Atribacterota bacterium]|nr:hypothetical protein [Atribacterota bacterium]
MKDKKEWEKKIERLLVNLFEEESIPLAYARIVGIQDYIHKVLKAQKQDLKKKVEGMKNEIPFYIGGHQDYVDTGYNQAILDIIKLLEE